MNHNPQPPALKSPSTLIDRPPRRTPTPGHGTNNDGRQADPTTTTPTPTVGDGRTPIGWLTVNAPGRGTIPTATSTCICGRNRSAVGQQRVTALITDHHNHKHACPHHPRQATPSQNRTAA